MSRPSPEFSTQNMLGFTFFRSFLKSLEHRNQRLSLRRTDLMADLLRDRAKRTDINFDDVSQADLLLFLRDELHPDDQLNTFHGWYPYTLLYSANRYTPFEIFARSQSTKYFEQLKIALGIETKDRLGQLIDDFKTGSRELPRSSSRRINVTSLIGLDQIGTRP